MLVPSERSKRVVIVALVSNIAITVCKYVAAGVTGSAAMLAEAFHSTADTGNELLLLIGMKRSRRPPDELHPYGHGKVLYFYAVLVAVYIFGIGGGLAFYEGISRLRHPEAATHVIWNYAVLALAGVFDFYSWRVSYKELLARKDPGESTWDEIIGSKDPTVFTVFLEDSVGLIGVALAFLGIFLDQVFKILYLDPIASILIGLLLAAVAVFLARESGALIVGERAHRSKIARAKRVIESDPSVEKIGKVLTMQLGPDQVLLTANIRFRRGLTVQAVESAIERVEKRIQQEEPTIKRIFIEAESLK